MKNSIEQLQDQQITEIQCFLLLWFSFLDLQIRRKDTYKQSLDDVYQDRSNEFYLSWGWTPTVLKETRTKYLKLYSYIARPLKIFGSTVHTWYGVLRNHFM